MKRDLPVSFELKRWMAMRHPSFWMSDSCRGIVDATIYMFEGKKLDLLDSHFAAPEALQTLRLPERRCIFEIKNEPTADDMRPGQSFVTHTVLYCWEDSANDLHALLFRRKSKRFWSRAELHVYFDRQGCDWIYHGTPETPPGFAWTNEVLGATGKGASGCLARGCLALTLTQPETARMPTTKRQHLARKGVGGFEYKIVDVPDPPRGKGPHLGGTHASPRWHKRRGHYRTMKSGARVWVRDCEVGDPLRGMVIKDYEVTP